MIARLLVDSGDYRVIVGDVSQAALERIAGAGRRGHAARECRLAGGAGRALAGCDSVISALSFYHNPLVAEAALAAGASYFDLTEDVATSDGFAKSPNGRATARSSCRSAASRRASFRSSRNDLTAGSSSSTPCSMRVGALPQFPTGELKYNLTWSTDGLINEYCNPCEAIHDGRRIDVLPLEGLEHFSLDGVRYEAFNTSGGLGTLCDTLDGQVRELNYKTVRYVGHRDLMKLLIDELRLSEHRERSRTFWKARCRSRSRTSWSRSAPSPGWRNGQLVQKSDARKIYHQQIGGENVECDPDHDGGRHLRRARSACRRAICRDADSCSRNR